MSLSLDKTKTLEYSTAGGYLSGDPILINNATYLVDASGGSTDVYISDAHHDDIGSISEVHDTSYTSIADLIAGLNSSSTIQSVTVYSGMNILATGITSSTGINPPTYGGVYQVRSVNRGVTISAVPNPGGVNVPAYATTWTVQPVRAYASYIRQGTDAGKYFLAGDPTDNTSWADNTSNILWYLYETVATGFSSNTNDTEAFGPFGSPNAIKFVGSVIQAWLKL